MKMGREFENYNKNIDEFDARNIFEFDSLKELNLRRFIDFQRKKFQKLKKAERLKNKSIITFN
jgi:hypothetical protein